MSQTNPVLNLILTHQSASQVAKMVDYWKECVDSQSILIAHGGERNEFEKIEHAQKFFVEEPRLRTSDHQREMQSYTPLFHSAAKFLHEQGGRFQFVHFAEYDHIPLVTDLNQRQQARLEAEQADVLGFHVERIDGTSSSHFLYHAGNQAFAPFWRKISCRSESGVVLTMFGTGSFWTARAFSAVASLKEGFPVYMEIYLPTLAHHLGFRVRDFSDQNRFVRARRGEIDSVDQARKEGAWTLHPIKDRWSK